MSVKSSDDFGLASATFGRMDVNCDLQRSQTPRTSGVVLTMRSLRLSMIQVYRRGYGRFVACLIVCRSSSDRF
jgi:hypothetical protein